MEVHCFDFHGVIHTSVEYTTGKHNKFKGVVDASFTPETCTPNHSILRMMESLMQNEHRVVVVVLRDEEDAASRFFSRPDIKTTYPNISRRAWPNNTFLVDVAKAYSKLDALQRHKCTHFYDDSEDVLHELYDMIINEQFVNYLEHVYYVETMNGESSVTRDMLVDWKKAAPNKKPEYVPPNLLTRWIRGHEFDFEFFKKGHMFYKGQRKRCDRIKSGWMGTKDIALKYTRTGDPCCYRLVRDVVVFHMSSSNLQKLVDTGIPEQVNVVTDGGTQPLQYLLNRRFVPNRKSQDLDDLYALKGLCHLFKHNDEFKCDGYSAPRRRNNDGTTFHPEVAFCRPGKVLEECDGKPVKLLPESVDPEWTDDPLPEWVMTQAVIGSDVDVIRKKLQRRRNEKLGIPSLTAAV